MAQALLTSLFYLWVRSRRCDVNQSSPKNFEAHALTSSQIKRENATIISLPFCFLVLNVFKARFVELCVGDGIDWCYEVNWRSLHSYGLGCSFLIKDSIHDEVVEVSVNLMYTTV